MHIEDVFVKFFKFTVSGGSTFGNRHSIFPVDDFDVCYSFYQAIRDGKAFTEKQRTYVLALLSRYAGLSTKMGLDYRKELVNPTWKYPIRVINKQKRVWVEMADDNITPWLCLQFPYQLKEQFDDKIERGYPGRTVWDNDRKLRKMLLYATNMFAVQDFIEQNGFSVDESYEEEFHQYEEVHNNAENILPYATKLNDELFLVNCAAPLEAYWDEHKTGNYEADLLLIKFLGIPFITPNPTSTVEIIASSPNNKFWQPDLANFIKMCYTIEGRVGIVLDRASCTEDWLTEFYATFYDLGHSIDDIKVCIKTGRHQNAGLNEWIEANKSAGTNKAKFLIFMHKPSKWVFKDKIDFSIIGTNSVYPSPTKLTSVWMSDHPCVMYLTSIKPSAAKGKEIVKV